MKKTVVLTIAAASCYCLAQVVWLNKEPYPAMGYGSSPANQIVGSRQIFTQTAWVSDKDTYYQQTQADIESEIINTSLSIEHSITSGALLGEPNIGVDPTTGKKTYIYSIQAPELAESGEQVTKVDTFVGVDTENRPGVPSTKYHDNNTTSMAKALRYFVWVIPSSWVDIRSHRFFEFEPALGVL